MSDFLTKVSTARFKGSNYLQAFGSKVGLHQVSLSGLANAIDSLKGDE
jgi:hypothetical protein